jgi:hypothetical protein
MDARSPGSAFDPLVLAARNGDHGKGGAMAKSYLDVVSEAREVTEQTHVQTVQTP